jgi:hypothetical protein
MPRNGSGTYTRPQSDYVPGTTILATSVNSDLNDMAQALTASIARDGQTTPTGNLPMGNFRHTGVADGAARTDYAALGQTQNGAFLWGGTAGGTANAATISLNPPLAAYAAGQRFAFVASAANTGAVTLNVNGLGATALNKGDGTVALTAGDIPSGAIITAQHDGTRFRLIGAGFGVFAAGTAAAPGLAVSGDPNTGIFSPGADQLAVSLGGVELARWEAGRYQMAGGDGATLFRVSGASYALRLQSLAATGMNVEAVNPAEATFQPLLLGGSVIDFRLSGTKTAGITSGGDLQFNSGYGSVATAYGCRAWVNFNGTGTVAIRASGNVSSITDNGTGDYTVNFTTNMPNTNYAVVFGGTSVNGRFTRTKETSSGDSNPVSKTTTAVRIFHASATADPADCADVNLAIIR